jgi:uncharacterized protein (DUF486 family)
LEHGIRRILLGGASEPMGRVYSVAQLKTMQEVITLVIFAGFSVVCLQQAITCRVRNDRDWRALCVSRAAMRFHERGN